MLTEIDTLHHVARFLDPLHTCMLARTSKYINSTLKDIAHKHKHEAYERLFRLDVATDIFSVHRQWRNFNALYIVRKETAVRRRMRRKRVTVCEFQFGFYTGRKDEWHHCILSLPSFQTNFGARLTVTSYDRNDERIVTRTFDTIFTVEALIRIIETRHWHSRYFIFKNRWSYLEGEPSPVLVLGFEE